MVGMKSKAQATVREIMGMIKEGTSKTLHKPVMEAQGKAEKFAGKAEKKMGENERSHRR
jgi:uncharacterized protein YjbJ (UPF0337 family)